MQHILFCSGGKDSVASALIAKEKGEPLDAVAFCEVMFDEETSGEHPLHRDFVYNTLQPFVVNELKVPFIVLRGAKTYKAFFEHAIASGTMKGKTAGFPIPGMCSIQRDCKTRVVDRFKRGKNLVEYVGIAADEPKRIARLNGNKISLLEKYNYTEADAKKKCQEYGLLSPVYEVSKRNGCWFCMNCCDSEWVWLLKHRPDLFNKLCELEQKHPERARICMTRTETPSQIKERLEAIWKQISFFD